MKTVMPLPEDEGREFFAPVTTQTYNTLVLHCRDIRFSPVMNVYEPDNSTFRWLWRTQTT